MFDTVQHELMVVEENMLILQMIVVSLVWGCIYGLVGMGLSFIYRASGFMTFCQGELLMLGAFLTMFLFKTLDIPFLLAFPVVLVIMFGVGLLIERVIIRTLSRLLSKGGHSSDVGTAVVLATIGLAIVLQNFAMLVFGADIYRFPPLFGVLMMKIGGLNIVPEWILIVAVTAIFSIVFGVFMRASKFGIAMEAAVQNPMAAKSVGINTSRTTGLTWGIASVMAAIAGILLAPIQGVGIAMGTTIGLKAFAGAIIGGFGETFGALLGGIIVGLVENFGGYLIPTEFKDILVFAVLILIIILKPTGILRAKVYE
jgi:branched-chain amino acid transport system permease protein